MNEKKENVIVNGFFWRFAERCGVQLISAVVSILLARILTPDDYGKVALVTVFNNIMYVLLDCGIGTALVQKKEVDELDYSSAFFFSIVISFVLYGGMFVAAPYLAAFYNDPSMTPIFRGISLTVAVCGIKTIQQAHVTRNMKFQYFFYSAFAGAIVSTVLGLGLAYMGFGVWALVVQQVSNITVDTLVLWKLSSWRPKMEFSWQHLKGLLSYGWKLLASSLSSVIYNNLRSLIIGKMYTSADLAYYNQGDNLTYNIASSVDTSIESVLFPVMSSLQDDRAQVRNMTRRSIKTCTYIIAPVMMSTDTFGSASMAETRRPARASTPHSASAWRITAPGFAPIPAPTSGALSTITTRTFSSLPSTSRSRCGISAALSSPVSPAPTTTAVLRAGVEGLAASALIWASKRCALSSVSTLKPYSAKPGTAGTESRLPVAHTRRS